MRISNLAGMIQYANEVNENLDRIPLNLTMTVELNRTEMAEFKSQIREKYCKEPSPLWFESIASFTKIKICNVKFFIFLES